MAYKKIFLALDDSPQMDYVFERALETAALHKAHLLIGHVVNSGPMEAKSSLPHDYIPNQIHEYDALIEPYLKRAQATEGIASVQYTNLTGPIRETLLEEEIMPFDPDLVICGARGLSVIKYALLGSVSSFLVKHVDCDVLVIKNKE